VTGKDNSSLAVAETNRIYITEELYSSVRKAARLHVLVCSFPQICCFLVRYCFFFFRSNRWVNLQVLICRSSGVPAVAALVQQLMCNTREGNFPGDGRNKKLALQVKGKQTVNEKLRLSS